MECGIPASHRMRTLNISSIPAPPLSLPATTVAGSAVCGPSLDPYPLFAKFGLFKDLSNRHVLQLICDQSLTPEGVKK